MSACYWTRDYEVRAVRGRYELWVRARQRLGSRRPSRLARRFNATHDFGDAIAWVRRLQAEFDTPKREVIGKGAWDHRQQGGPCPKRPPTDPEPTLAEQRAIQARIAQARRERRA